MKNKWDVRDFVGHNGHFSNPRLVFLLCTIVILYLLVKNPENQGLQNIVMSIVGFAAAAFTASKFAKSETKDEPKDEINA